MSSQLPEYMTASQAAEALHVKPVEVARLCRSGAIKAYQPGKAWLITPEALQDYIERATRGGEVA